MRITYFSTVCSTVVAIIGLLEPASARNQAPGHELPFVSDVAGTVLVPAFIGGAGPYRLALDTGSSGSAISADLAGRLSLPVVSRTEVISAAGRGVRSLVEAGPVRVGPASVRALRLTLTAGADMERPGLRIDGILGQDFLAAFNYTLDYRRRRVIWDDFDVTAPATDRASAAADRVPFARVEGQFIVELPAGAEKRPLRLVVDTGAPVVVLFGHSDAALSFARTTAARLDARGLGGTRPASPVLVRELTLGVRVLRDQPAVVIDGAGREDVDGLLPLRPFGRVSIRSRDGYLVVGR